MNVHRFLRSHISAMDAYTPILPFEVLSQQLGLSDDAIIKLDANENPYGPLSEVAEALAAMPYAHIYPDPESRHLRAALADYHNVPVENILAGAGADEMIDLIMRLMLDPGDVIINCPPTFGMYRFDAGINNADAIAVPRSKSFELDLNRIAAVVAESAPKAIFLASPNNPNGGLLPVETLDTLLDLPLLVILDEAYVEFASPGSSRINEVPRRKNLIVLRTFSKWAGLAGLRLGYGIFPDWIMPHLWKIKQPYNVSVAASTAGLVSLENADQLTITGQKIVRERERLFAALEDIPWLKPYPSQANFILCQVIGRGAAQLKADLAAEGILIRYFDKPGLSDHVRISVGKPEQTDILMDWLATL
jgi:histidinol-phosphate aminotransferase